MSKIHVVVGDCAATNLQAVIQQNASLAGDVLILKDILHVGTLQSEEGKAFSAVRSEFWQEVTGDEKEIFVDDLERLMQVSTQLSNSDAMQLWLWMAPCPADICAYYWILHYMKKHVGKIYTININGLPFLDDDSKLFYPDNIAQLSTKEISKAQKLARILTPSEWETDGDEWARLVEENAGIRRLAGGKKLHGDDISYYDEQWLKLLTNNNQKVSRLCAQLFQKYKNPTGDTFMLWRLRILAQQGIVKIEKNDVRLNTTDVASAEGNEIASS